jgi:hypothetical protein
MAVPEAHQCSTCADDTALGTTVHEDLVLGAPLSMEELDDARRLERFAGKYAHDGCKVIEVRKVASATLSGFGWSVRFVEDGSGQLVH